MPVKHLVKKNTRQKKLIHRVSMNMEGAGVSEPNLSSVKKREAAIVRQFNQIQKDYLRLVSDVVKELDLVKGWIGNQAMSKKDQLRTRLNTRLSKT